MRKILAPFIYFDTVSYANGFNIANGGPSQPIKVLVCDRNLNQLTPGSTVTISSDVGKLVGNLSRIFMNSDAIGPNYNGRLSLIDYNFIIMDDDAADTEPTASGAITVSVEWEGTTYSSYIAGSAD